MSTSTRRVRLNKPIELNLVRAAMVDDPADYRWSSYRSNEFGQANPLLTPHALFVDLGHDERLKS